LDFTYRQSAYPRYNRIKKNFPSLFRKKLNDIEDKIAINPTLGEKKKVDLKEIRVYKFKLFDQQILLAYQVDEEAKEVIFIAAGGHENFYRDLKRYLK
jgi:mRNA-degrading endonuclease RelE of RelBE toxin-antitoxin system